MIKSNDGTKLSAKRKAQEILIHTLEKAFYIDLEDQLGMTEAQAQAVKEHMSKQMAKIENIFKKEG